MGYSYDYFDTGMRWRYRGLLTQTQVSEVIGLKIVGAPGDRLLVDTIVLRGTFASGRSLFADLRDSLNDYSIETLISTSSSAASGSYFRMAKASLAGATGSVANLVGKLNDFVIVAGDDILRVGGTDLAQNETLEVIVSGWVEHDLPTITDIGANQTTSEVYNKTV